MFFVDAMPSQRRDVGAVFAKINYVIFPQAFKLLITHIHIEGKTYYTL